VAQRPSQPTPADTACARSARRRGQHSFADGLGVERSRRTPRRSNGGCAGQGGAVGFSPETAGGGGAEKTDRCGGVPWWRWSSDGRGGYRRVLQLEERTREVKRGPKAADDGGTAELTEAEGGGR
jgi:hypothetical protein